MSKMPQILKQIAGAEGFRYLVERRHLLQAADEIERLETTIANKARDWAEVHDLLLTVMGTVVAEPNVTGQPTVLELVEKLRAIAKHHESQSIKLAAFCARLQHADDLPEDVLAETRALVREWKRHPAKGTDHASST